MYEYLPHVYIHLTRNNVSFPNIFILRVMYSHMLSLNGLIGAIRLLWSGLMCMFIYIYIYKILEIDKKIIKEKKEQLFEVLNIFILLWDCSWTWMGLDLGFQLPVHPSLGAAWRRLLAQGSPTQRFPLEASRLLL